MHRVKHYFERILNNLSTRGRESLRENRRRVVGCWKIRMRGCNERERTVVKMRKKKFKARYTLLIGGDLLFVAERNFVGGLRESIVVRDRRGWENVAVYTRLFPCCYRWKKKKLSVTFYADSSLSLLLSGRKINQIYICLNLSSFQTNFPKFYLGRKFGILQNHLVIRL